MKEVFAIVGAATGGWRRGVCGALFGAGVGWTLGWLWTPDGSSPLSDEHYRRYPEEEIIDAFREAEGAEMAEFFREISGET